MAVEAGRGWSWFRLATGGEVVLVSGYALAGFLI